MTQQTIERVRHFRSIQAQYGKLSIASEVTEQMEVCDIIDVMITLGLPRGFNQYHDQLLDYLTYNNDLDQVATEFIATLDSEEYQQVIDKAIKNI